MREDIVPGEREKWFILGCRLAVAVLIVLYLLAAAVPAQVLEL